MVIGIYEDLTILRKKPKEKKKYHISIFGVSYEVNFVVSSSLIKENYIYNK